MPRTRNTTDDRLLSVYLHDHLAGSAGGVELANRVAKAHADTPIGPALSRLAREIEQDRDALRQVLSDLRMPEHHVHEGLTWLAEKAARLKPNGQLIGRSPLSSLIELETMRIALEGKRAGWDTLRLLADDDERLDPGRLEALIARTIDQADRVEELRQAIARTVFRVDSSQEV
ncbi:MAG: hypothetical protein QOI76_465 [Frankiales bacterium]|nr:hypothetical protein [Frankiales bacterium]